MSSAMAAGLSVDLKSIREATNKMQAQAASPLASAWVSANAGTGKTHVLVQRVLRLMLAGTPAERILCLTFTKAAASEMANRLFRDLSRWTMLPDDELKVLVSGLVGKPASDADLSRARQLFALALETPGGLKVQTIHAFCERLLQRFPLEAGVAPHFTVLDEEQGKTLKRQAIDKALGIGAEDQASDLGKALRSVIAYAGDSYFDDVLGEALADRGGLGAALQIADETCSLSDVETSMRVALGLSRNLDEDAVLRDMSVLLSDEFMDSAIGALSDGKKSDIDLAEGLRRIKNAPSDAARAQVMGGVFLTKDGAPRSDRTFVTKAVREERPDVAERLRLARDQFAELNGSLAALRAASASASLVLLADAVMRDYDRAKSSRAALDFDDLISKTSELLAQSNASAWVLYKLDGGIDHILVDEAQDTSPHAWEVIETLADEFFAGAGARPRARTVFAVGDEKQSIYGFQGAVPEKFAEMGAKFGGKAKEAEAPWHPVPLTLSFRSTAPVLKAVDIVFGSGERLSGLSTRDDKIQHYANRLGQSGVVELWETEKPLKGGETDPWDPLSERVDQDDPKVRLANRIADEIKGWLTNNEMLPTHGRAIRPGDILILVRKRAPFAPAMIAALKARNIPVAGADRITLTEQLAVMDLMALGDFLLLSEDDLALATVLKSPLFDLDDDDLFAIGHGRDHSLWEALGKKVQGDDKYKEVYETLRFFLARSDLKPPYEFFESLLDWEGRRARFVERLGPEAGDAIDEFLNLALTYDDKAPPSLQGFMSWLRNSSAEVKRDMEQGRDEVRVMTVHGAKGLEANIVFMPDTCSAKGAQTSQSVIRMGERDATGQATGPIFWAIPPAKNLEIVEDAREQKSAQSREEYHRLLYVAMTRARDRLYVCGFENKTGRDRGCWYDLMRERLEPHMVVSSAEEAGDIWRLESVQDDAPDRHDVIVRAELLGADLPAWAFEKAPSEPVRMIPVAPSGLVPLEEDDDSVETPVEVADAQPIMPPRQMASDVRFLRGRLTHALLEHLPSIDPSKWEEAASKLVEMRGGALYPEARESIVAETLEVLRSPRFAPLFGADSMAEVPLTAKLDSQADDSAPILITGQIDRLAVVGDEVLIVDYKTNRPPPQIAEDVAASYLAQLAAYRVAIGKIYSKKSVKCAILWTDGPKLMEIPTKLLDEHEVDLLTRKSSRT